MSVVSKFENYGFSVLEVNVLKVFCVVFGKLYELNPVFHVQLISIFRWMKTKCGSYLPDMARLRK